MDEPLAPWTITRASRCRWLEQWKDDRMTIVFVTHDLEEACYVGTRVIGLSQYWSDDAGNLAWEPLS